MEEETDETLYWLELLHDLRGQDDPGLESLLREADELLRIFVSARKTARSNSMQR